LHQLQGLSNCICCLGRGRWYGSSAWRLCTRSPSF